LEIVTPGKRVADKDLFSTDHLKKDLKRRAVRGGGFAIFARSTDFFIQLVGTMFLARILTPEDFGLVAMVTTVTGFFLIFKDMGLSEATIQSEKISHEQVSTLFWINIVFSLLITILVCALAPLISYFYKDPRLTMITVVSSVSFLVAGFLTQHMALMKRSMQFSFIAIIEVVSALLSLIITILLAVRGASYWALVIRPIIMSLFMAAGVWIVCGWRPGIPVRGSGVKGLLKFGANALGYYIVNYFARNIDKALIGWRSGAGPLGFYNKAFQLFIVPINQFSIPLHGVAVTTLSKLKNEPEQYRNFFMKALGAVSFLAMPLSTFLASVSHDLILFLLGPQWIPATRIFSVLGLSAGFQIVYSTKSWLHVSLGRTDRWLRWGIWASVITTIFFFAGLPFGIMGIAAGYTISLMTLTIPGLLYAGKPAQFTAIYLIAGIWRYYAAAVIAGITSFILARQILLDSLILKLSICFGAFSACYLLLIIILYRGVAPLREFIGLMGNMLPEKRRVRVR